MIEATKRVATAKDIKRIRKVVRERRRSGEEVFTDDELEAANFERPPNDARFPHVRIKATKHMDLSPGSLQPRSSFNGDPERMYMDERHSSIESFLMVGDTSSGSWVPMSRTESSTSC